jgi:cell division protein FtsL
MQALQSDAELNSLRSKVDKQRNEIARLQQTVARLSTEKAELLLDLKMYKAELERAETFTRFGVAQ